MIQLLRSPANPIEASAPRWSFRAAVLGGAPTSISYREGGNPWEAGLFI